MSAMGSQHEVILRDAERERWLRFRRPRQIVATHAAQEVLPLLRLVQERVQAGNLHAAGFLAYEAAPAFDRALRVRDAAPFPLLWFGLYGEPEVVELPQAPERAPVEEPKWQPSVTQAQYGRAFRTIKEQIAAGRTYQVNYSYRLRAPFPGQAWPTFLQLVRAQKATYGAYVDTGRYALCCASPELFFRREGPRLALRPMKGTAARGLTWQEDAAQAEWLQQSQKNRAENVMIVDMIRNDVGRVAQVGSVSVPRLFAVEKYPTVWQMTSTVTARTKAGLAEVMQALFPCASITGAPKASTMAIIAELETSPRRIYTGTVGFLTPQGRAQFNVAIRTLLVDRQAGQAEFGVGGGVVWDSTEEGEFEECSTKAQILSAGRPAFHLLETLLWTREEGYALLEAHLQRLARSADYFDYAADVEAVRTALARAAEGFAGQARRVRLLLDETGAVTIESRPYSADGAAEAQRVCLAPTPVDSGDPFLYHKTTNRRVYEEALAACPGYDDVLLWNERGEVTESCRANVVVELDGERLTPPISCGLLPGTYRAHLLQEGRVREGVVHVADLQRCTGLWLVNSVRGELETDKASLTRRELA